MSSFYYRVGGTYTRTPWLLPNFLRVRELASELADDSELSDFDIFFGGDILKRGITWDIKVLLEFENWETDLDMIRLESVMSKIYKIGFNHNLLLDVTFCGNHQLDDLWVDAQSRGFLIPSYNHSDFIKFESVVKSVDGISNEWLVSDNYDVEFVSDLLVKWSNVDKKYTNDLINGESTWIFKEGLPIDVFLSFSLSQFESLKY